MAFILNMLTRKVFSNYMKLPVPQYREYHVCADVITLFEK